MSLKKFISGISAFAVAATAFAAMAVTASAKDYGPTDYTANFSTVKKASWTSGGVFTAQALNSGEYAAAYLNFSALPDIDKATSVTITFDTYVYANTVTCYGFGDASQRSGIANSSGVYRTGGIAAYFGSTNGTDYKINDVKTGQSINCGASYFATKVPASITFDKEAGTYSFTIGAKKATMQTNITNLTYIDAYTNTSGGKFGLMNVKVSYTVPDAPAEPQVTATVGEKAAFTIAGGYDNDMVVGNLTVTVKNGTYDLSNAKYNQKQGTVTDTDGNTPDKTEITGDANGTSVIVFAVLKGVDDVAELNNIVFE